MWATCKRVRQAASNTEEVNRQAPISITVDPIPIGPPNPPLNPQQIHRAQRVLRPQIILCPLREEPRARAAPPADLLVFGPQAKRVIGDSCPICLMEFVDGDSCRFLRGCFHGYHRKCIEEWFLTSGRASCPICRSDYS
ncbi:hypothetical protein MLD38_003167 [Melastoma candidum]|uniref:Uncharacterized protein n=1 Tax=Melastoma candidum TaxID=119954 RepID=A0ACB9S1H8_9MYRT|nr:hypothetical protein MLD38_003167 [Melastoma candidum]